VRATWSSIHGPTSSRSARAADPARAPSSHHVSGYRRPQATFPNAGAGDGFRSSRGRESATLGFVQLPTAGSGMNSRIS
jgi:hypothetical protein